MRIQWDWDTMGQRHNETGTQWYSGNSGRESDGDEDTVGQGHNGTGTQWDGDMMGQGHNGTGT